MLTNLQAKIAAARAIINEPRTTIVEKSVATQNVAQLCTEIDGLLEHQVDGVTFPLRKTHPELYNRYTAARAVARRPSRRDAEPAAAPSTALQAAA